MDRSVAQGRAPAARAFRALDWLSHRWRSLAIAAVLLAAATFAYTIQDPPRYYNHFVWQAEAFLDGEAAIRYPVPASQETRGNAFFQDVLPLRAPDGTPTGRGLLPFPPLPAIVLMPFVAVWGLATSDQLIASLVAVVDVALAWWVLGRLRVAESIRIATTVFFAFGTVFWYAAQLGTTWYFAHIVALAPLLLALGLALGADPHSVEDEDDLATEPEAAEAERATSGPRHAFARPWTLIDGRQVAIGFLFGLAATARLPIIVGAPFLVLVGSGGTWWRRGISAGLGAVVPIAALLGYNLATTGHLFHPAYEFLYRAEAFGYPGLGYNLAWAIEDPRYIPQNLAIMLLSAPALLPDAIPAALGDYGRLCTDPGAVRGLFDATCPLAVPRDIGMSLLLTSPAYLLAVPALRLHGRSRLVTGSVVAVLLIAVVNLMHFSQGWVQFGYRFSLDFAPFLLLLVAIGLARRGGVGLLAGALVVASIAVTAWGIAWGRTLGW